MSFPSQNQRVVIQTVDAAVGDIMKAKGPDISFVATTPPTPTHYVSLTGIDGAGVNGSLATPWRTLAYAATRLVSGNVLMIKAGTYTENQYAVIGVGVSLCGERGSNGEHLTKIFSRVNTGSDQNIFWIKLESGSITDGNQFIRDIWFDGSVIDTSTPDHDPALLCTHGILINRRNNVKVFNNRISNFWQIGIIFRNINTVDNSIAVTSWCTGNEFYNNYLYNSCAYGFTGAFGSGSMQISGQDTLLIHHNYIKGNAREITKHGYLIKFDGNGGGFNKNLKIYNNNFEKACEGEPFDFAVELWNLYGGTEIYNNYFIGSIDMSQNTGVRGTGYAYEMWIHDNVFGPDSYSKASGTSAAVIEIDMIGVIFERNLVRNVSAAVILVSQKANSPLSNITIQNNVVYNSTILACTSSGNAATTTIANVSVVNNTIVCDNDKMGDGLAFSSIGNWTNLNILNNLIVGYWRSGIFSFGSGTTGDIINIKNNIIYLCGHSNTWWQNGSSFALTNVTNTGNISNLSTLPIVSYTDLRLVAGSPAINAGVVDALVPTTDFTGFTRTGNPDIGAYEYH